MSGGIAFCFGAILMAAVTLVSLNEHITMGEEARNQIKECQKTLPRNVECVIVAVPETEIEED